MTDSDAAGQATIDISNPRGRAMLSWAEKRPPSPVPVPRTRLIEIADPREELPLAQLSASRTAASTPGNFLGYAIPNSLYYGENKATLAHLLANGWRGRVRLIYIDPPFDSGSEYTSKVRQRKKRGRILGQTFQYQDNWNGDSYLQFIYERLFLLRELLAENGSIWLHCDYRQEHRLRLLLEEVFGEENYLNTITWRSQVARGAKVNAFYFPFSAQFIQVFAKDRSAPTLWHPQKRQLIFSRSQAAARFMEDEQGFFRTSDPGTYSFERLKLLHEQGRLYAPYNGEVIIDEAEQRVYASNGGNIGVKYYLTRIGENRFAAQRGVDNLWDDIPGLGTTPGEDVGYPTQKTEALLRRIIASATDPGDLVLDCFAGSGTTAAVAQKMGRHWIACDNSYGSIQIVRQRLQRVLHDTGPGFAIYQVNEPDASPQTVETPTTATATIQIQRSPTDRSAIDVQITGYQFDPAWFAAEDVEPDRARSIQQENWRTLIAAVDIDPAYDGSIFRAVITDAPHKRQQQVRGRYQIANAEPSTTIALRITDIFGNETLIEKTR